jgi:hypothetical protein
VLEKVEQAIALLKEAREGLDNGPDGLQADVAIAATKGLLRRLKPEPSVVGFIPRLAGSAEMCAELGIDDPMADL